MTGKTNGKMLRFPPGEPRRRACVLALPSRGPGPSVTPRAVAASLFVTVLFANFPIGTSRPPATRSLNLVPHPLPKRFGVSPPPSGRGGRRAEAAAGSTREGREGEERHADRRARAGGRRSEDPVGDRGRGRIGAGGAAGRSGRAGGPAGAAEGAQLPAPPSGCTHRPRALPKSLKLFGLGGRGPGGEAARGEVSAFPGHFGLGLHSVARFRRRPRLLRPRRERGSPRRPGGRARRVRAGCLGRERPPALPGGN